MNTGKAMPTVLAVESSGDTCSVALLHDEGCWQRQSAPGERQSERMLNWVDALLVDAGIPPSAVDALAVTIGPGAFTGVRLGVAMTQGLAMAWNRPVIPVSTLMAFASGATPAGLPILAAMDARMGEVYAGWFRAATAAAMPESIGAETVLAPDALARPAGVSDYVVVGSAWSVHGGTITRVLGEPAQAFAQSAPEASTVARLARQLWPDAARLPDRLVPAYLRDKVALTTAERMA